MWKVKEDTRRMKMKEEEMPRIVEQRRGKKKNQTKIQKII